jgi:hypothetical protein
VADVEADTARRGGVGLRQHAAVVAEDPGPDAREGVGHDVARAQRR